jgi:predicted flap endonuclease-1-like 5' DNA nuclease
MAGKSEYEMKQVEAYRIAEADGFRQHPDVYWHQAETAPSTSKPRKKPAKKKVATKKKTTTKPKPAKKDKLTVIEGIGPKIAGLLNADGIVTFADLAKTKIGTLEKILKAAGPRFSFHKPNSWPKQARLARDGKMDALKKLQDELDGGR